MAVLHNQIEHPAHVCGDDLTGRTNFMPQELSGSLVTDEIRSKGLECHFHAKLQVEGVPHLPLTATPEQTQEAVAAAKDQVRTKGPIQLRSGGVRDGVRRR